MPLFNIHGIELMLEDTPDSRTLPFIVQELEFGAYGLQKDLDLAPGDLFLDLGANVGIVACYVAKKFGCQVVAIEPVEPTFQDLRRNIWLNGLEGQVMPHRYAVASKDEETVHIRYNALRPGNAGRYLPRVNFEDEVYPCEVLGNGIINALKPRYVKIDVEGAEYAVVPEIMPCLKKAKYVGIELHETPEHDVNSLDPYLEELENHGVTVFSSWAS